MNKRQPNFTYDEMEVIGCWCGGKQRSECRTNVPATGAVILKDDRTTIRHTVTRI